MEASIRFLLSLIVILVGLIPFWFFLGVKWLLGPEGFWQRLIAYGIGFWLLGTIQLCFLVFGAWFLIVIWTHKPPQGEA